MCILLTRALYTNNSPYPALCMSAKLRIPLRRGEVPINNFYQLTLTDTNIVFRINSTKYYGITS